MAASIVGAWRVTVSIPGVGGQSVNLANFGADGTVVVAFAPASPGPNHHTEFFSTALGSWVAAADGSVQTTFVSLGADETGAPAGTHTISAQATVSADGATWAGPFRIDIDGATGERVASVNGSVQATRIVAAPFQPAPGGTAGAAD